jgi:hypothetical protein
LAGVLSEATERAIAVRGTVMLAPPGDERRWCAICAAVDGSVELRVGEPSRGWWRRSEAPGEAWLREHDFVHVVDAWAQPAPRDASPYLCADILATALQQAFGAPPDGALAEVLVHPGMLGDVPPPAPDAPHADHIRYAVSALAARGSGKADIQGGRPAATWAWLFAGDGELNLSPEPLEWPPDYDARDWTVPLDADLAAEADKLTAILHDDLGRSPGEPLFISFMPG